MYVCMYIYIRMYVFLHTYLRTGVYLHIRIYTQAKSMYIIWVYRWKTGQPCNSQNGLRVVSRSGSRSKPDLWKQGILMFILMDYIQYTIRYTIYPLPYTIYHMPYTLYHIL